MKFIFLVTLSMISFVLMACSSQRVTPDASSKITSIAPKTTRHPSSQTACTPIEHATDEELDYSPTGKLIQAQTTCTAASQVFDNCPHGAMYSGYENSSILDHSSLVISICEKEIKKDAEIERLYRRKGKLCDFKVSAGGERQAEAWSDECQRGLAIKLGIISEMK